MNWYTTDNVGAVVDGGERTTDDDAMCGPAVMYDAVNAKVLAVGGSPDYKDKDATTNAHVITIGEVNQAAEVKQVADMQEARVFANSIVLPDRSVYVLLLLTKSAAMSAARTYHSVALPMPDARVFVGGGGLCGNCGDNNHFDGHIYSPPYLFSENGGAGVQRPITKQTNAEAEIGSMIQVTMPNDTPDDVAFSMVRMGTSTHTVNTDQRRVPLQATANRTTHSIQLPNDPGILLPGYWYLFAMANGVPSRASIVQGKPQGPQVDSLEDPIASMASNGTAKRSAGKHFVS